MFFCVLLTTLLASYFSSTSAQCPGNSPGICIELADCQRQFPNCQCPLQCVTFTGRTNKRCIAPPLQCAPPFLDPVVGSPGDPEPDAPQRSSRQPFVVVSGIIILCGVLLGFIVLLVKPKTPNPLAGPRRS